MQDRTTPTSAYTIRGFCKSLQNNVDRCEILKMLLAVLLVYRSSYYA